MRTLPLPPPARLQLRTKASQPGELKAAISEAFAVDGPAIVDAVVVPNEFPNIPHFDLETIGNFARAKMKEAIIAVTGS